MGLRLKRNHIFLVMLFAALLAATMTGCTGYTSAATSGTADTQPSSETTAEVAADEVERPEGWTEETHGNEAEPNYDVVFPDDKVNQITITIDSEGWEAMQANMVDLFGEAGAGSGSDFPGGFERPAADGFLNGPEPPVGRDQAAQPQGRPPGNRPGGGGVGGGDMTPENPMWVSATIEFEGNTWTNVGVRYKGNSSLTSSWRNGTLKLPLKLDFDEFENDYPEIEDQRFYGFKQLSLGNGFSDASFLRDAATSAILQEAGLPAAETAFYEVVLDYGEGPVSLGLYTMIEVVDDTVVGRYFGSDDGNIYEGEGAAASFAASTYNRIEESFQKENNEEDADWSDIESLFNVLHDDQRTGDPASWRASLESIFDVDAFLEWLAISAVIQHWDAYGNMNHNYYLYHDPNSGQLTWISWDHNQAMSSGPGGGERRGPGARTVSLDKADVDENWPLIRHLLDDPVYYARYLNHLAETVAGPFDPDHMAETYREWAELIEPYATTDVGAEAFDEAVQQLIQHAYQRADAVQEFLSTSGGTDTQ